MNFKGRKAAASMASKAKTDARSLTDSRSCYCLTIWHFSANFSPTFDRPGGSCLRLALDFNSMANSMTNYIEEKFAIITCGSYTGFNSIANILPAGQYFMCVFARIMDDFDPTSSIVLAILLREIESIISVNIWGRY